VPFEPLLQIYEDSGIYPTGPPVSNTKQAGFLIPPHIAYPFTFTFRAIQSGSHAAEKILTKEVPVDEITGG
jgi:hypothetical protein